MRAKIEHTYVPAFSMSFVRPKDSVTTTKSNFLYLFFTSGSPSTSIFSAARKIKCKIECHAMKTIEAEEKEEENDKEEE